MRSEIRTFPCPGGTVRAQAVFPAGWEGFRFFPPKPDALAFERLTALYRDFIVPKYPWLYTQLAFFRLPDDVPLPAGAEASAARFGSSSDRLFLAAAVLRRGLRIIGRKPVFLTADAGTLWTALTERGCTACVYGLRPGTAVLPVDNGLGFLSQSASETGACSNLGFFTMDRTDCMSPYDRIGTPVGLRVKDGRIISPPLFGREALTVTDDGAVTVQTPELGNLTVTVGRTVFRAGGNARLFARPAFRHTPPGRETELVIIGNRVIAVRKGGGTCVPSSGFVLRPYETVPVGPGERVDFSGLENVRFGVQVGNSILINGRETNGFRSPFANIRVPFSVLYPPSLYPIDFKRDRAPRLAVGADGAGRPMLVWIEGRGKFSSDPEGESCGASLSETIGICRAFGMVTGVHLDGGGSAQIRLEGKRFLRVSDRDGTTFAERERGIPECLGWE